MVVTTLELQHEKWNVGNHNVGYYNYGNGSTNHCYSGGYNNLLCVEERFFIFDPEFQTKETKKKFKAATGLDLG